MKSFIRRNLYKLYIFININLTWYLWYLNNYNRTHKLCKVLDTWNKDVPSFQFNFPLINSKILIRNYKYWLHWIRKMDPKEQLIFKSYNPYVLINEEEWMHFDFSKKEIPVIYFYFYFPDRIWNEITIFKSLEQLESYIRITGATSDTLIEYINTSIQTEKVLGANKRITEDTVSHQKIIFDGVGIRLAQN
jgi:hypothetical protein